MLKIKPSKNTPPPRPLAQRAPPQGGSDQPPAKKPKSVPPPVRSEQPPANKPKSVPPPGKKPNSVNHSSILIKREASETASEGLEILLGRYTAQANRLNHSQVVYKKVPGDDDEDPVFLYFFGNTEADRGWWLGHEVNGAEAYCWAPSAGFPPPISGWRIPTDDQPAVEDLRVLYPAPATGEVDPEEALLEKPTEDEVSPVWNLLHEVPEEAVQAEIEQMDSRSNKPKQPDTVPPPNLLNRPAPAASVGAEIARLKAASSQPKTVPPPKAKGVEERSPAAQVVSASAAIEKLKTSSSQPSLAKIVLPKAQEVEQTSPATQAQSVSAAIERLKAASSQPKTVPPKAKPVPVEPAEIDRFRTLLGKVVTGVVETFEEDTGFLSSEDFTGDLPLNKADVDPGLDLVPGMEVSFKIRFRSQTGKAEAYEVKEVPTTSPVVPTADPGALRDAAISAGLSSEDAIWLDHFYQDRTLYWRIVNATTTQTGNKELAAAGSALIDIFPKPTS